MHRSSLALLLLAAAAPVSAAEVQVQAQGPVIELTVTEIAETKPDLAQVGAGVTTRAATATEAARLNAQKMARVIARLRELGVRSEDIQTSQFSLNAQWNHRPAGAPVFAGYDVSNQVNVRLRDMDRIGATLDALIAVGANSIYGPNFMVEDDKAAKSRARRAAFASAEARARELAGLAGHSNVRLLEISETYQGMRQMNDMVVTASAVGAVAESKIEPGQVGVGATLIVKYEMIR